MRATIVVDPYRILGRVDPRIYGQFLSRRRWAADGGLHDPAHPDADESGCRRTVVEHIAESGPTVLRWPGGCTGTSYDWREGIGPRELRPRSLDAHFGYDVGNGFGTAEFVEFCRRVGAEPHLNLNTGLGNLREALQWIEYCNYPGESKYANLRRDHGHADPFKVRYWQIGNENYGPWEIGAQSPEGYAAMAREWAKAIKKLDPSLQVLAVGASQKRADWDYQVLAQAWPHIDYLTAHRYWDFDSGRGADNYDAIAAVGFIEEQTMRALGGLRDLIGREHPGKHRPRLAFTEWNCRDVSHGEMSREWRPDQTQYRLVDALAAAGFINAMRRQCQLVTLANLAQCINVVGMLLVTPEQVVRETVYWAFLLQRRYSGPVSIDAWVDCDGYLIDVPRAVTNEAVPYLDVNATMDEGRGRLFVAVVNRHRECEIIARLRMRDATTSSSTRSYRLFHDDPLARNTPESPDLIAPEMEEWEESGSERELVLPPHSFTIYEFSLT